MLSKITKKRTKVGDLVIQNAGGGGNGPGGFWVPPPPAMAAATLWATRPARQTIEITILCFLSIPKTRLARHSQHVRTMSQARPIQPGKTYLITRRTERRHCLLRPDPLMNAFILYSFIVSAHHHGILLHAFCAMSTHMHYVITDPQGALPQFLAMFHRLVALGVKIIHKWDGAVWDRAQTSVVELCTRQAIVGKIAYTLANPVEAGLVWDANEWPGFKTDVNDIDEKTLETTRPNQYFRAKNPKWIPCAQILVSLPPSIPEADAQAFRDDIREELTNLENAAHSKIPEHKVLGSKRATKIMPESRVTRHEPQRQPRTEKRP